ncbi:type I polyketide synthase [Nocardia alni]|uniref:type I polyketide synthase n=1 Tax=Nocardia alni TaxID=2815723 RepID=UPI001C223DA9|nr:type I polyketide synthase [Nocardia alni]
MTGTPVSIIGIGCRVPGAHGVREFWELLSEGRDGTGAPPPGRSGTRRAGYLDRLDRFDNGWFAISDREAAVMDPQQRLSLEVAVEALDDAGIGYRIRGSRAAVLFGACGYDHGTMVLGHSGYDAPYAVTGSALSIIAGRLSYALDLHGPSLVLDSACSSSLAAVDLAMRLLADDTVPLAIVGGVNLTLLPHTSDYLDQGGFLAADGRCKPFDADADGYTRSDGCTVLILQRTADARREGNRIYAEIAGAAVGSDGRSNGLYAPNGLAQQQVVRTAWARAHTDPRTAGYFECHGTGTALGDAVEVGALAEVLSGGRDNPIWIGSVKSNLGHLEAAAGVTGLAKAALSIAHARIVPTINFRRENPLLKLTDRGLRVPTEPVDWQAQAPRDRWAGVSSFGFGGTNAHAVLRGVDAPPPARDIAPAALIPITGRDLSEVRERAARWAAALADEGALGDIASATARLIPESVRAAVLARDRADAVTQLGALAAERPNQPDSDASTRIDAERGRSDTVESPARQGVCAAAERRGRVYGPTTPRRGGIVLVFSGQGGQHAEMGRGLAARYPVFARALAEAAEAVADCGGPRVWTPRDGFAHSLDGTATVQPALFVYQVAAAHLLAHWGIRPDAVIGHSLGEIAGAVVSGALSLTDGAWLAVARGTLLARLDGLGAMALLEAEPEEAERLVEPLRRRVGIAAVNGPRSVVVSGTEPHIDTLVRRARRQNLFARRIAVDFAAHGPQVREIAGELIPLLDGIDPHAPRVPVYSTARRGAVLTSAAMDAHYWADNAAATVELAAALEAATADGLSTAIEVSPHPVLTHAIREYPDLRDSTYPMADRDDESAALLDAIARLYREGRSVDWSAQGPFGGPMLERRWRRQDFPLVIDAGSDPGRDDLADHVVQGVPTVPAMYWLRQLQRTTRDGATRLVDFTVHDRTDLSALAQVSYRVGGELVEAAGPLTLASARIAVAPAPAEIVGWMRTVDAHRAHTGLRPLDPARFYAALRARGLEYGPRFRPLRGLFHGPRSAIGLFDHIALDSAALDGCLQLIAAAAQELLPARALPLPVSIDSAWVTDTPAILLAQAHAFVRTGDSSGLHCDVLATDQHGTPAVALLGVRIRYAELPADHSTAARRLESRPEDSAPAVRTGADNPAAGRIANSYSAATGYEWLAPEAVDGHGPWAPALYAAGISRPPDPPAQPGRNGSPRLESPVEHPVLRRPQWYPVELPKTNSAQRDSLVGRVLVIGESRLAVTLTQAVGARLAAERIARDPGEASPIVPAVLTGRTEPTAVVALWPAAEPSGAVLAEVGRALELLQRIQDCAAMASLTVVLRERISPAQQGIAGLVRSLQLESGRPVRLVWVRDDRTEPGPLTDLVLRTHGPQEIRIGPDGLQARRFVPVLDSGSPVQISAAGTYVVTGGLGALGAVAVRWLLDAGAGEVVALTRRPRPVPPLLEAFEDRIVVVRCDVTDRRDLATALHDIRECGLPIRGFVHSAGALTDAEFGSVTPDLLASMFEPKLTAATTLLELTAEDPIDIALLFSSATGVLGAPGQAAYAAANAALDAVALAQRDRRVISIGWGSWASGLVSGAGGAAHLRRAGIVPFDPARGTAVLAALRGVRDPYVLALDYTPTADTSAVALRLRAMLPVDAAPPPAADPPSPAPHFSSPNPASTHPLPTNGSHEPVAAVIRAALAGALDLPTENLAADADFTALGLSSLLAIEVRRTLEARLGIRIATAELFEHRTIAALDAALSDRVPAR